MPDIIVYKRTSDGHHDHINVWNLIQDLKTDCTLSSDDLEVVERMNQCTAMSCQMRHASRVSIVKGVPDQFNSCSVKLSPCYFDHRSPKGHKNC
jgi:hypothetical protein